MMLAKKNIRLIHIRRIVVVLVLFFLDRRWKKVIKELWFQDNFTTGIYRGITYTVIYDLYKLYRIKWILKPLESGQSYESKIIFNRRRFLYWYCQSESWITRTCFSQQQSPTVYSLT